MQKSDFDYQPEQDDLPKNVVFWIIISAIAAALYLSQILV